MHYVVEESGVFHITTGALAEYPIEYRVIEVHDDRLEITTQALSDKTFATRSLVHDHTLAAGQECDRSLTIPFAAPRNAAVSD